MKSSKLYNLKGNVLISFLLIVIVILSLIVGMAIAPSRQKDDYTLFDKYLLDLNELWVYDSDTEVHFDIPKEAPVSLLLKYETDFQASKLYLDDTLLLETTENSLESCIYTYWVDFDHLSEFENLRIVAESHDALEDIIKNSIYLGSASAVLSRFILDKIFPLVFSCVAIISGLLIFILYAWIRVKKTIPTKINIFYLAVFIFVSGWWILTDCQFLSIFVEGSETVDVINYVSITCIGSSLIAIFRGMFDDNYKILDILRIALLAVTCAGSLGWIAFGIRIFTLLTVSHIFLGLSAAVSLWLALKEWKKYHSRHTGMLLIGMLGLVIGGLASIIAFYVNGTGIYTTLYTATLLYFIIDIVITASVRIVYHMRKLELGEKKALEQAKQSAESASEAKTGFLLGVSHDIRTPMNAILGYANVAKKHLEDSQYTEDCLNNIISSGDILLGIINEVLDMSRIETGELEINETAMNISEFARNMLAVISDSALSKSLNLNSDFNDVTDSVVYADKMHLESVLLNILSNAVKYTDNGGSVFFGLRQSQSQQLGFNRYTFTVTDDGVGMSPEFLEKIFDPFVRADKTGTNGTGLGMSITKNLIDMMNGEIKITSIPGNGTSVKVSFDFKKAEAMVSAEEVIGNYESLKGRRVLIVDDNRQNREIVKSLLDFAGIITEESDDGAFALEMVRNNEPGYYDALLMDIQMPYMDGYKATTYIRALGNKEKASVPIVAMTANAFETDRRKSLEAGMNAHLAKPIDERELLETLLAITR